MSGRPSRSTGLSSTCFSAADVAVDPDVTSTLTAVIVALGVLLVALLGIAAKVLTYAKVGAHQATAANRATNGIGDGEHRLYDMVLRMDEKLHVLVDAHEDFYDRGWHRLDGDLADATKLTMTIRQLQAATENAHVQRASILADLAALDKLIRTHDEWERSQKWSILADPDHLK